MLFTSLRLHSLKFFLVLVVNLNLIHCLKYESLDQQFGKLVFSNVLYRHGDRTPIDFYPTDPYKNSTNWPEGLGQLTNVGKNQHLALGKWLRKHFQGFLPEKYSADDIYLVSTDVDRCLMSAESNLAGLYPPKGRQVWGSIKWQPIPVHTVPETQDKLLAMYAPCKRYDEEFKKASNSGKIKEWTKKYKGLMDYVSEHTGRKIDSLVHLEYIHSTLFIESLHNFTLPDWTKSVYPEPMKTAGAYSFAVETANKQLQRLKAGPLLKDMLGHFQAKKEGTLVPNRKVWVYSAHDTTVSNLLNTLGLFDPPMNPPFATAVLLELRKAAHRNNQYFVNVLLKNTSGDPTVMTVPGCPTECPLHKFIELYQDILPVDWDAECDLHHFLDFTSDLPYNTLAIFEKHMESKVNEDPVIRRLKKLSRGNHRGHHH